MKNFWNYLDVFCLRVPIGRAGATGDSTSNRHSWAKTTISDIFHCSLPTIRGLYREVYRYIHIRQIQSTSRHVQCLRSVSRKAPVSDRQRPATCARRRGGTWWATTRRRVNYPVDHHPRRGERPGERGVPRGTPAPIRRGPPERASFPARSSHRRCCPKTSGRRTRSRRRTRPGPNRANRGAPASSRRCPSHPHGFHTPIPPGCLKRYTTLINRWMSLKNELKILNQNASFFCSFLY